MKADLKAYQINPINLDWQHDSIQRGYIFEPVYGKDEHEARRNALKLCTEYGVDETDIGNPLTYIDVRIKRLPSCDKFLVDGKLKTQEQIEYDQKVVDNRNKLNQMLIDHKGKYAYILKGGYYYMPNHCGYTEHRCNAGVYTIEDAVNSCLGVDLRDYMRPEVIDISTHNKMIDDKINQLQSRKLTDHD